MIQVHVIINPISGTVSKDNIPTIIDELFSKDSYQCTIHYTEYSGHASELTLRAISLNADYVIAVGGDGTINEIARSMVHSKAALGIVPCGSGNGLARDLGIPMDIKKSLHIISQGNITSIDYCKANEHIFFCTCGFGFDAIISERFSRTKQRGSLSYVKSAFNEYFKFTPEDYELIIDGVAINEKAFLLTCANASQYGNSAFIAPKANIQDGKMDVVIVSPISPLGAAPFVIQLFTKQIHNHSKAQIYRAESVIVVRKKIGMMHVDGDPIKVGKKIEVKIIPSGLNVIVPYKHQIQSYLQVQVQDFRSLLREATLWISNVNPFSNDNM